MYPGNIIELWGFMKNKCKLVGAFLVACSLSSAAMAIEADYKPAGYSKDTNDYESNYYATEGSILFKIRAMGIMSKSQNKNFPNPTTQPPVKAGHFITNGYGVEGSTTIYFTDNIGAELGLGVAVLRTSNSAIKAANYNYGNSGVVMKNKDVYGVPLSLMAHYSIAPFGPIDPYVGVGYQGMYFFTKSRVYRLSNAHGIAMQVGVDFKLRDDTILNLDVKRYNLSPKLTYSSKYLGSAYPVSGNVKINPVIVSVGIGFKF